MPVFGDLVETCLSKSPAYSQLQSKSETLRQIREQTVSLATAFPDLAAFRAHNLFPKHDTVACIGCLPTDFPAEFDPDGTHTSICKPSRSYLRPLVFVRHDEYEIARAS
jgi:hypothetical protein